MAAKADGRAGPELCVPKELLHVDQRHRVSPGLVESQPQSDWPRLCNELVRDSHPLHEEIEHPLPLPCYWSVSESEYASDVMFRKAATTRRLYPRIVHHAITSFGSTEVLRFRERRGRESGWADF